MGRFKPYGPTSPETKIYWATRRQHAAMTQRAADLNMSHTQYCCWLVLKDCYEAGIIDDVLAPDLAPDDPEPKKANDAQK